MTIELLSVQQNRNTFFEIQIIDTIHYLLLTHKMKGGEGEVWPWIEGWNNESRIVALNETKL